jgi:hypothetical protein
MVGSNNGVAGDHRSLSKITPRPLADQQRLSELAAAGVEGTNRRKI